MHPSDADYRENVDNSDITQNSKVTYHFRLQSIQKLTGLNIHDIMYGAAKVVPILEKKMPAVVSRKNAYGAVLAYMKANGIRNTAAANEWEKHFIQVQNEQTEQASTAIPMGRAKTGYIEWPKILAAREHLAHEAYGSREHLLLSMYTYIPPRRAEDYSYVFIDGIKLRPPHNVEEATAVLDMPTSTITVSRYKTAKTYGEWTKELPSELMAVIRASLAKDPRNILFPARGGVPFKSAKPYDRNVNRALERVLGENITVNSLRHAAAQENLSARKSKKERQQYALDMGHSFDVHQGYELHPPEKD